MNLIAIKLAIRISTWYFDVTPQTISHSVFPFSAHNFTANTSKLIVISSIIEFSWKIVMDLWQAPWARFMNYVYPCWNLKMASWPVAIHFAPKTHIIWLGPREASGLGGGPDSGTSLWDGDTENISHDYRQCLRCRYTTCSIVSWMNAGETQNLLAVWFSA